MTFAAPRGKKSLLQRTLAALRTDIGVILAITLLYWVSQLLTYRLGIIPGDEGFSALAPLQLLQGHKPYTQFPWPYGPTGLLLNASLYRIFGVGLLTLRTAGIFAGYLALLLSWKLARRVMPPWWAGMAATSALALYRLPTYNYNHIYATVLGLLALNAAWAALQKQRAALWALSGALVGLLFTFKANVGAQAALAFLLFLILKRQPLRTIFAFGGAALGVVGLEHVLLLLWLGTPQALPQVYAFQLGIAQRYLTGRSPLQALAAAIPRSISRHAVRQVYYGALFLSPLVVPLLAWRASRTAHPRTRDGILLLALYSPAVYLQAFLVADPTGSTGDNSALLPTTLLLAIYALYRWAAAQRVTARRLAVCGIAVLAALLVYAGALLRYTTPGKFQQALTLDRARGVRVSQVYGSNLEHLIRFLQASVAPDEPIAALPWGDLIPFLAEREQAAQAHEDFAETLAQNGPRWLVLTNIVETSVDERRLRAIVDSEYSLVREFGPFLPLREQTRRTTPTWEDTLAYRVYTRKQDAP